MKTFLYDGSYQGFLCALHRIMGEPAGTASLRRREEPQQNLFTEEFIPLQPILAQGIKQQIRSQISPQAENIIQAAFLSQEEGIEEVLLNFIFKGFKLGSDILSSYSAPWAAPVLKAATRTHRECHRFLGIIRFQETSDGGYYSPIEPDSHILPLVGGHFKNRYPRTSWIIHDLRRQQALIHQAEWGTLKIRRLELQEPHGMENPLRECKPEITQLWQEYFLATSNKDRRNLKLQHQFLPKKLWKHLVEFQTGKSL